MPTISIVIPAYNVAGYLEKCLDSLIEQSYKELEIIVVNDGSTDNTPYICDQYALRDSRIKIIHKDNEGVSEARNTGIEAATGEYIFFFDGDDFVEPDTCEELLMMITDKNVDALIYGYHCYENGEVTSTRYPIFEEGFYEGHAILKEVVPRFIGVSYDGVNRWLKREENALYVENPALWRIMLRTEIIKNNQLRFNRNLKVGEDTIFISEYLSHAQNCYVYHKCFYYLVTRETSTIYKYERNPIAKLEGKINLLVARLELTERIKRRTSINIDSHWRGTVLMSSVEMAFLLARKHPSYTFMQRYKLFSKYFKQLEVRRTLQNYKIDMVPNIKIIPFLMMKWNMFFILFGCMPLLHLMNYKFQRE